MKTWKYYIQVNGDGVSIFGNPEFEVSDEMYEKIQKAVAEGKPLESCGFCKELKDLALDSFNLADRVGLTEEEPFEEDFDDEEEFEAAKEEYQEMIDGVWENYCLETLIIEDPGEEDRFKARFVGKKYPAFAGQGEYEFRFERNDEVCATYCATVHFDPDGKITDITNIWAQGLESESVKSSSYGDCYPEYDLIADILEEELQEAEEENEEEE